MRTGGILRSMTPSAWRIWPALLLLLFSLVALAPAHPAHAGEAPPDVEKTLGETRKALDKVQQALAQDKINPGTLSTLRRQALEIQSSANTAADALDPQLSSVQARLTELGEVPEGAKEASDVAAQRAQLQKNLSALDSQIKLARLMSVEAGQAVDTVSSQRRAQFEAQMGERTSSLLGSEFWSEFRGDAPRDLERLAQIGGGFKAALDDISLTVWAAMLLGIVALVALHLWAAHRLLKITATRVPSGRLRRSVHAITLVILGLAIPGLMAQVLHAGLAWTDTLDGDARSLVRDAAVMVCFAGYVAGLGVALLSATRTSWRLPAIADLPARRLRSFPVMLASNLMFIWLVERLATEINASLTLTVTVNVIITLTLGGLLATALLRFERARAHAFDNPEAQDPAPRPVWVSVVYAIAWAVLLTAAVCLLSGYVAFASFIVKQLAWTLVVLTSAYLFSVFADDVFTTILTPVRSQDDATPREYAQPMLRAQLAVLFSGAVKVVLALLALLLLLAPFGAGPLELSQRLDVMRGGVAIGEVVIRPARVVQAMVVLALTLIAVRLFKGWLARRYLPTTRLDPGMQASASTLFGYVGIVLAIALSMSAIGIGLERIAWVASALSVGIGFGLQAVVQNFVSGLIMLAERPVKVGDWVSLSGVEGDIVRVNVRATEIQMADRSTVIVPNSEFITKTVRNVTHDSPLGLVSLKLPMPLACDAGQVRELILAAFSRHPGVLEAPAASVLLDSIDANGNLIFAATAYVSSPRAAYGVRSAIMFDILSSLRDAGVDVYRPPAMVLNGQQPATPPPQPGALPGPAQPTGL